MSKYRSCVVGFSAVVLLLMAVIAIQAAPQATNFAGTWQLTMERGGGGGRGGNGGGENGGGGRNGGGRARGGGEQTLTIAQDGNKYKVTHKTLRSEDTFDATVSDNTISWTEMGSVRDFV